MGILSTPIFLAFVLILVYSFLWYKTIHTNQTPKSESNELSLSLTRLCEPAECSQLLCNNCCDGSSNRNRFSQLESRALPNQRLIRAFGIDNAFTTTDDAYRKEFRGIARQILKNPTAQDWSYYADTARQLVRKGSRHFDFEPRERWHLGGVFLDKLVQSVSLKIILQVLFGLDPLTLDNAAVLQLASSINELWVDSKTNDSYNTKLQEDTVDALKRIFPNLDMSPRTNPLNLILPAWETLWRVVLLAFIEITFHPNAEAYWRTPLLYYLDEPNQGTFTLRYPNPKTSSSISISASDIVCEALRLYPPTRRVHRAFKNEKNALKIISADIEACHRDPIIFGKDRLSFNPSRWCDDSPELKAGFMPFGKGAFVCPAEADFGPKMVGLLVAAFAAEIRAAEWRVEVEQVEREEPCGFGNEWHWDGREPLRSERGAYKWVGIFRKVE